MSVIIKIRDGNTRTLQAWFYQIAHKTKQSSAMAQVNGTEYLAKNMLENQPAALADKDCGDFRT